MLFSIRFQIQVVISLLLLSCISCDTPDLCYGSPVTAIERVIFLDEIERYFVSSGRYYWFVNQTNDLPTSHTSKELPFGFAPDAALIKDTRACYNGQYTILLIQKKHIIGSNEEEWLTMEYTIGEWGDNGTDSGLWNEPNRIARCSLDSKVCSTSDNYFAVMNFNFKRSLDAAFGVIGQNAYFIQDSLIYNVSYRTPCVNNPYSEVFAQSPQPLPTRVSAGSISDNQITLFDREFYINLSNTMNITADELEDDDWSQAPSNFFTSCPPLTTTISSILYGIFNDSRSRSMSVTVLTIIIIVCLLVIISVCLLIVWMSFRRKTMRITKSSDNADETGSDSPLHEEHLLKNNDSPKTVANDNNKDPNQPTV